MYEEREKIEYLKKRGSLNLNASGVKDELFTKDEFFDPLDSIQVKYELLRKVSRENLSVKDAVSLFGISRQYYYKLKDAFEQRGILGLLPEKRGPKGSFKVTDEITDYMENLMKEEPTINNKQIAQKIASRFNIIIHPRTIERKIRGIKTRRIKK